MDPETVLDGLNGPQRHAVTNPAATLVIEAGAGSGKTRVLTRRIAYRVHEQGIDPRNVMAITFTRKAAGELATRLRGLGLRDMVTTGTFHSIAYGQLRARWADRGIDPPALLERKVGFVARLLPAGCEASPIEVVAEIEWAKARLVAPSQYPSVANAEGRRTPIHHSDIGELYTRYETEKRRRRVVDFDDLLRACCYDINEDREFAAALHWRHRHLFVDEFQDVNPLQFALLQAWLGNRDDLTVVGDPNQAIYGWNGADAHYLTDFTDYWPEAEMVLLDENYRSTPQILTAAGAVLGGPGATLRPTVADGPAPTVRAYDDDRAEAAGIARSIRDHRGPGERWSGQAVLVRTNAQAALIEAALRAAGIPFRVRGGRSIVDEPEVKRALLELGRSPLPFLSAVSDLEGGLADAGAPDEASDRQTLIRTLVRLAHDYAAIDTTPSLPAFEAWLRDTTGGDVHHPDADAVDVCTFHAAKGLEWPVVHLAGLEAGLVPIGHAKTPDALAEERRLLYVAATRAERELHCSWALERTFGTRTVRRQPSPHLAEIEGTTAGVTPQAAPDPDRADFFAEQRTKLRSVDGSAGRPARDAAVVDLTPPEEEVLAALRDWRSSTARAANVAPYVVFADRTLVELAQRRPLTHDELLGVSGIGPVKAGRYGDALLRVVRQHRVG